MPRIPLLDQLPFSVVSIGGLVIIVFLVMLFAKPLGKMAKLLLHAVLGFVMPKNPFYKTFSSLHLSGLRIPSRQCCLIRQSSGPAAVWLSCLTFFYLVPCFLCLS